jgi:hypothetical protein
LRDAQELGQLGRGATQDEGLALLSIVQAGIVSQQLSNEPKAAFERGRFTSLLPDAIAMFVAAFPPESSRANRGAAKGSHR